MPQRKGKRRWYDNIFGGDFFPPARPIRVEDGIQSRSKQGAFAANWWAKRWLAVLEGYGLGSRLQRGRSYARSGQVLSIDVRPGLVQARVQGSRPRPYAVDIRVSLLSDKEWTRALDAISQQAIFAARLLDSDMPQEIETAFNEAGVALFPARMQDIQTRCSCPDSSNPCKHIAAVHYLLGEQFDQDPFLIFTLRGRTREQVIEALRMRRAAAAADSSEGDAALDTGTPALSLNDQIADFWGGALEWSPPLIGAPDVEAAVLRRLGAPPANLKQPLASLYKAMTVHVKLKTAGDDETPQ
ncbi:MAG TPA: SWIM zinc finger family protein [Aggregatilineales bacterium]|nr:SWIM zinc finger family protein [Aggregatilineales bacterium]